MLDLVPSLSLSRVLDSLRGIAAVEAAIVLDRSGRVLASSCPRSWSPKAIAAACSRVLAATEAEPIALESPVRVDIRGRRGSTILVSAGDEAILAVVAKTTTPESLSLEIARVTEEIRAAVSGGRAAPASG